MNIQRAFDALEHELQQLRAEKHRHRSVVACTRCRSVSGAMCDDDEVCLIIVKC
jgi:hypothetical protein